MNKTDFQEYYRLLSNHQQDKTSIKKFIKTLKKVERQNFDEFLKRLIEEPSITKQILAEIGEKNFDGLYELGYSIKKVDVLETFFSNKNLAFALLTRFKNYEEYLLEQRLSKLVKKDDSCKERIIQDIFSLAKHCQIQDEDFMKFVDEAKTHYLRREKDYYANLYELYVLLKKGRIFEFVFEMFKRVCQFLEILCKVLGAIFSMLPHH